MYTHSILIDEGISLLSEYTITSCYDIYICSNFSAIYQLPDLTGYERTDSYNKLTGKIPGVVVLKP